MAAETLAEQVEDAWPEALDDSHEVLEHVRQLWRDEDRAVDLDDERRDEVA